MTGKRKSTEAYGCGPWVLVRDTGPSDEQIDALVAGLDTVVRERLRQNVRRGAERDTSPGTWGGAECRIELRCPPGQPNRWLVELQAEFRCGSAATLRRLYQIRYGRTSLNRAKRHGNQRLVADSSRRRAAESL